MPSDWGLPLLTAGGWPGGFLRQFVGGTLLGRTNFFFMTLCRRDRRALIDPWWSRGHGCYFGQEHRPRRSARTTRLRETCARPSTRSPGRGRPRSSPAAPIPAWCRGFVKTAPARHRGATPIRRSRAEEPRGWGHWPTSSDFKGIHIAERDTRRSKKPNRIERFVNTWSWKAFVSEGRQPAELGCGQPESG